jgi:hypothetical protein
MIELDESAIPIPLAKIGPILREDVGMDVDFEHVYFPPTRSLTSFVQTAFAPSPFGRGLG